MKKLFLLFTLVFWGSIAIAQEEASCPTGYICSKTDSTSSVSSDSTTTVVSPPPSAISPSINTSNSDLCTVGVAGAVQTQILGISAGTTFTEDNCVRLKNAKVLYDMGMKVAAVSTMCQDPRVFDAMMNAGTPCPYDGLIGDAAKAAWIADEEAQPESTDRKGVLGNMDDETKSQAVGIGGVIGILLLLFGL
jgi:hypothetical protein